MIVQPGG